MLFPGAGSPSAFGSGGSCHLHPLDAGSTLSPGLQTPPERPLGRRSRSCATCATTSFLTTPWRRPPAPCPVPAQCACKVLAAARDTPFPSLLLPPLESQEGCTHPIQCLARGRLWNTCPSHRHSKATGAGRPAGSRHEELQEERTRCVRRPLPGHKGPGLSGQHLPWGR